MHVKFVNTYTAVILRQLYDDIIVLHPDVHNSQSHQTHTSFLITVISISTWPHY